MAKLKSAKLRVRGIQAKTRRSLGAKRLMKTIPAEQRSSPFKKSPGSFQNRLFRQALANTLRKR